MTTEENSETGRKTLKRKRYFPNEAQARTFVSGLESLTNSSLISVNCRLYDEIELGKFGWLVQWEEGVSLRGRRQQPEIKEPMSSQEWIDVYFGEVCPFCGGKDLDWIVSYAILWSSSMAVRFCRCQNPECEKTYRAIYKLDGYEIAIDKMER